ncbi:MAG TPA: HAD-IA family hydrolase [Candidatus Methylomirabilis sp.]|nr:HAD-IA family hydrolase [Candidatus Methylomirabilis sp.]HSD51706.1 HAD-IA family hydrolase [Candidatus Methylomirabilis sp.]
MLRAVTFDLWQTLLLDTPEGLRRARADRIRGIHEALAGHGLVADLEAVDRAYDAVGPRLENVWATQRDVGPRDQVRLLLECVGLDGGVSADGALMDTLEEAYCLPILSALPILHAGARDVLEKLQGRGLRLALICNTGRTPGKMLRLVLERVGLLGYLRVLSFSDELGLRKPHPEIFHRTLSALGIPPTEAAHVGDDVTTDVTGARGVGMRAIHLCHPTSVSQDSDGAESIPSLHALPAMLFSTH